MGLLNKLEILKDEDTTGDFLKIKRMLDNSETLLEVMKIENLRTDNDMVIALTNKRVLIADAKLVNATEMKLSLNSTNIEVSTSGRPMINVNGTFYKVKTHRQALKFKQLFEHQKNLTTVL